MRYQFRPLGTWPGRATPVPARRRSQFKATYPATLELLFSEADKLSARELVLQIDIAERWIRTDGLPAANARYGSNPGVIVSFDSKYGPLSYPTDRFTEWRDNLRAIALALEALRTVDRYGVTRRGEQYTGWRALPAGNGHGFATADEALAWMRAQAGPGSGELAVGALYRKLARRMHPDVSRDPASWSRLDTARTMLATAGLL